MTTKTASTTAPVHPLLAQRWSPRAFAPDHDLTDADLRSLLEAARWAPSANNSQPWRFGIARRGSAEFEAVVASLMPANQVWARNASALLLVAAETMTPDGVARPWATYDAGQATAHLSVQAEALGLSAHQMGGFDRAAASEVFELPVGVEPVVVIALGRRGDVEMLPEPYADRERAVRSRLPLDELLLPAATTVRRTSLPLSA